MRDVLFDSFAETAGLAFEVLAMTFLLVIGILAEAAGFHELTLGLDAMTIWYFFFGAIALYAGGYMLGYQRVIPQLRGTVDE